MFTSEFIIKFFTLNFLDKLNENFDIESNLEFEKSKLSRLFLNKNEKISSSILLFLFFKFPSTEKFSSFFLIFKKSELNLV